MHIKTYLEIADRAQVVACCDIDPEKARSRAALAGDARYTTDYADILADDSIDAIDLCTPPHLHCDAVIAAAKAGKHIICQKPLARTLLECEQMIAAAKDAGVILYYAEMGRTNPGTVATRDAVRAGKLGKLVGLQCTFAYWQGGDYMGTAWRYDPKVAGGGQLLDSAIHALAFMREVGGDVESVACFTTRVRPELGGDDTSSLSLRFKNGALGTLYSTQAAALWYPPPNYAVFGTDGIIALGGRPFTAKLYLKDAPEHPESLQIETRNAFQAMIWPFVDCVLDGTPVPSTPGQGMEDLRLVLAAYEADRLGKTIELK